MKFEKLTHSNLKILKSKGFNILTSNNSLTDETLVWFPERINDIFDYLIAHDINCIIPHQEFEILVIDDAIRIMEEEYLIGDVFITYNLQE